MIKGIGPQLVRLLNGLGVHRFDDIASWMPEDIEMINSHLGQFRGAIIRDEWIQQARLLARGDMENFRQRYGHLR
jgi:predicted flap endonuclease-1-like 5' DNA nuclease